MLLLFKTILNRTKSREAVRKFEGFCEAINQEGYLRGNGSCMRETRNVLGGGGGVKFEEELEVGELNIDCYCGPQLIRMKKT